MQLAIEKQRDKVDRVRGEVEDRKGMREGKDGEQEERKELTFC